MNLEATGERGATVRAFMIADVRGYTAFTHERGDAEAARLAKRFADLAREAVEARLGRVIELRGDEALAVFDSTQQAVRAALEFQMTCAEETAAQPDLPLTVGIGIDVGEAIPVEDGFRGVALNTAARLCSKATAGQVLVTRDVVAGAEDPAEVRFEERGEVELKGFEEPVMVIEALSLDRPAARPMTGPAEGNLPPELDALTPLLDREREMQRLRGTWRQARRGRGRVLFLSGPSQIGKTRLAAEVAAEVAAQGARVAYAGPGGAATALAVGAIRDAVGANEPALVVLDDLDVAGEEAASTLDEALEAIASRPVLILATVKDTEANPRLAAAIERADRIGDGLLTLAPLGMEGVEGIAQLYVGDDVGHVPLESMARASAGVPGRVHEVVSDWARDEAGRRLAAAAEWLSEGRGRRSMDLDFANNVIGLKLGALYGGDAAGRSDDCPYKGLAAFEEDDASYFFGREQLVGELAARTVAVGLLGVVGASGSGKSSVVAAGLLPSLRAGLLPGSERWTQVLLRPGTHPMTELATALGSADTEPLEAAIRAVADGERLVVVIDQFEEVFTLCPDEAERERFLTAIAAAARTHPDRICFVLTIRDDFYGRCAPYRELSELLGENHVLVPPMTSDELRRAVELPARRAGLRVETALTEALVEEVAEEPGGLPLLSAALVELWQNRDQGWLRMSAYETTGGVRGAVARLAESTFLQLEQSEREVARRILLRLAGVGEGELVTRRRVQLTDLDADKDRATARVLARMTRDRLLTMSDSTVEVAHEALLREWPRLRAWLEEDLQGQKLWQHLTHAAKNWDASGRDASELYRGARLSAAIEWSVAHGRDLNELERSFLDESRQGSEREVERQRRTNRRLRVLLVGAGVLLVVALIAGGLAVVQRGRADDQAQRAEREARLAVARELAAAAVANLDVDPERSILLAAEGVDVTWEANRTVVPEAEEALHRALKSSRVLLTVPQGGGLAVSPDDTRFATTGDDGTATVWATEDGEQLLTLEGHEGPVNEVAFSPDGSRLATTGTDATVRVWDAASGDAIHVMRGHEGEVFGVAFSPDGKLLATLGADATIRIWNARSGTEARVLRGPEQAPFFVLGWAAEPAFSPDGSKIASGGWGKTATIWDVDTGSIAMTLPPHTWEVTGVAFSPDGSVLATAAAEGAARTWDARTGRRLTTFSGHTGDLLDLDYSADGDRIVTAGSDATATVWDAATGENLMTLAGHAAAVRLAAFTREGDRLVTAGADGTTRVWDIGITGERDWLTVPGPALRLGGVAFSPDAETLAVPKQLAGVTLRDVETGEEVMSLTGSEATISSVVFSPDGERLAGVTSSGATRGPRNWIIPIWDVGTGELALSLEGHEEEVPELAFSPDGNRIVTTGYDKTMRLWDAATGKELKQVEVEDSAFALGFTPDGRHVVAAPGYDGSVEVRDAETLQLRFTLKGHEDFVQRLSFAPDGRVVTSSGDGTARVWDLERRREVAVMRGHTGSALGVAFSPDGARVATSSDDGTAKIWNARTGREILTLYGHDRIVHSVAYSPDGRFLATASGDGTVALHLLPTEELRALARERVTRSLTDEECRTYLHLPRCPQG